MKRFIYLFIVFNSLFHIALSGFPIGSLEDRPGETAADTAKAMIFNEFVRMMLNGQVADLASIDMTAAEKYFKEAYETSLETGMIDKQAEALSGLSAVSYFNGDYSTSIYYLNKYQTIKDEAL